MFTDTPTFFHKLTIPRVSIAIIYALATKTGVLDADPMLWFAMMLMPIGPPAMILVALSDVNGSPETEKMAIASQHLRKHAKAQDAKAQDAKAQADEAAEWMARGSAQFRGADGRR